MAEPTPCSNPQCFMDASLMLKDMPYCVPCYRDANGGKILPVDEKPLRCSACGSIEVMHVDYVRKKGVCVA